MKKLKLKSSFKFARHELELAYSVFILIIVPVLIIANTIIFTNSASNDFDTELKRKADLVNEVFGSSIKNRLDDTEAIQITIDDVVENRPEVSSIVVTLPQEGVFRVVAADDYNLIGQEIDDVQYNIVKDRSRSVAQLVTDADDNRVWNIVTPIFDGEDLVATTAINVSLAQADQLVGSTLQRSFIVLLATTVVVVLLLWNHFRFVEYAQLYRKLQEADQLKNDFLSVATHELKAPMATIKGYTSNVIEGDYGEVSEDIKKNLGVVVNQADRLNNLVQDLLNVSRIEQGHIKIAIKPVLSSEIIKFIMSMYEDRAREKNIELNLVAVENEPKIAADVDRLEEVMTNLIDNAIKYSTAGKVVVRQKVDKKKMYISVKDSGIGMSSEERDRLFQRFYRVKNEKTKDIGGTGLGLWIIKQYVEKMGGRITVDSLEDVGTEFTVELPLV